MRNVIVIIVWAATAGMLAGVAAADDFGTGPNAFSIDFVTVNGDTNPTSGIGIVTNDFRIAVHETTNAQWSRFVAAYGPVAGSPAEAYGAMTAYPGDNRPMTNASWYAAAQFVNWLNTSTSHAPAYKFTGTQGTSDYTFDVWTPAEAAGGTNLYRHKDAMYFLPTEHEWVKAGYFNGTAIQKYSNASPGDLISSKPDPTKWNYYPSPGFEPWEVGNGVAEINGTYDMMGNVWEWLETPRLDTPPTYAPDAARCFHGGSFGNTAGGTTGGASAGDSLASTTGWGNYDPKWQVSTFGFRVASAVMAALPGDVNGDQIVDDADFAILAANFGTPTGMTWHTGDLTGDGMVDDADFAILAANFGTGSVTAGPAVPEPASMVVLMALGAVAGARRRGCGC